MILSRRWCATPPDAYEAGGGRAFRRLVPVYCVHIFWKRSKNRLSMVLRVAPVFENDCPRLTHSLHRRPSFMCSLPAQPRQPSRIETPPITPFTNLSFTARRPPFPLNRMEMYNIFLIF